MSQNVDNSESQKIVLIKERYCFIIYFNAPSSNNRQKNKKEEETIS